MRRRSAFIALGLLAAAPAAAHHGWSGYDSSQTVTLTGPITEIAYGNPHVEIGLEAEGSVMQIVLAPPSRLSRRGLPDGTMVVGDEASVEGYRHQTDTSELRAERITVKGQTVELR